MNANTYSDYGPNKYTFTKYTSYTSYTTHTMYMTVGNNQSLEAVRCCEGLNLGCTGLFLVWSETKRNDSEFFFSLKQKSRFHLRLEKETWWNGAKKRKPTKTCEKVKKQKRLKIVLSVSNRCWHHKLVPGVSSTSHQHKSAAELAKQVCTGIEICSS